MLNSGVSAINPGHGDISREPVEVKCCLPL